MLQIIDVLLILILAGFVFYGMFFGLIRSIGAFLGVIAGAFVASHFYLPISGWIETIFFGYNNLGKVIVFLILFTLANRLVGFLFYLLDRAFNIISIIPFLKTINRLGGIALGFVTGSLFLGIIIFVINKYAILESFFGRWLTNSEFASFFLKFAHLAMPIFPEVMKKLQSLI